MEEERPPRRSGGLHQVVGAFTKGRREGDDLIRERAKFLSGWARFGLAGMVIGAMFMRQDADRKEARADRESERSERAARDANLAGAIILMDRDIRDLKNSADTEREVCWQVRRLRKDGR